MYQVTNSRRSISQWGAMAEVILLQLVGRPKHLDMYDMKPDTLEEHRRPFRPVSTNVSGLDVREPMPRHARCADKETLIRSIAHAFDDHGGGSKPAMIGRMPAAPTGCDCSPGSTGCGGTSTPAARWPRCTVFIRRR